MTDIDSLYAQFHAEENRANHWQQKANEKSLEIAGLLNERQMLREALTKLTDSLVAEADRCEERKGIPQFQRDGKHRNTLLRIVGLIREALALAAPKESDPKV